MFEKSVYFLNFTFLCIDIVAKWEVLKDDLQFLYFTYCRKVSIDQTLN